MSRRSRRAKQSKKKSSRKGGLKWLAWTGAVILLLGVVGLFMGYQAIRNYLKSDEFRVMLGEEIGEMLGGEASFSSFQWTGWEVEVNNFDFSGEGGIQAIQGDNIDASVDIGAVWDGIYRVDDIRLSHVRVNADFREREETKEPEPDFIVEEVKEEAEELGFWARFLPDKVEVNRVDIGSVDVRANTDDGEWRLRNVGAVIKPGAGEGVYDLDLRGGDVRSPMALLDTLSLQNAKARYSKNRFHLISSDIDALERARVTMEGYYALDEGTWTFRGDVKGARIQEVIAEDWKQRLMGPLEIDYRVSGRPERDVKIDGSLEIKDGGVLTALPVLDRIAAYANTVRFRRLHLSKASLDFSKQGERLELTNIRLASEGLVHLEGDMRLSGDRITHGQFRLGVPPGTLAHLPGAETKVFRPGEQGWLWTSLVISGTLDSPQEDLSERLIAAAGERMFEMIPETGVWALKHGGAAVGEATKAILAEEGIVLGTGQNLLNGATDLIKKGSDTLNGDPVKGAIDVGKGAVDMGVGTLFDLFGSPIKKQE